MRFDGAVIREQNVTFAIAIVNGHVLANISARSAAVASFTAYFRVPTVLMSQDARGVPTYFGRPDIVRFLQNVHPSRIPWRTYTAA